MGFRESLEQEYGTQDLYEALGLSKDCKESEIKRAYHKLSLKVHPDRVDPGEIEEATRKFQVLSKVYSVLSDPEKRALYDETGIIPDDEHVPSDVNWTDVWKLLFKKVTIDDVKNFEKKYKGSDEEKEDLRSAYMDYEGNMDKILETVLCAEVEDLPRFHGLIACWIAEGSVPSFPAFTSETDATRRKRKRKREAEAKEAEKMKEELGLGDDKDSLKSLIKARQKDRESACNSFFDQLEKKYGKKTKSTAQNGKGGSKKKGKKK